MLLPSLWGSRAPSKAPNKHPTGKEPGPDPGTGSQQGAPHRCWVRAGGRSLLLFSAELPHNHLFNKKPGSQKSGGQKQDRDTRGRPSRSLTAPGGALHCAPSLPQAAPWHEGRAAGAENGTAGASNPAPPICASPEKAGRGLRSWGAPSPASLAVPPPSSPALSRRPRWRAPAARSAWLRSPAPAARRSGRAGRSAPSGPRRSCASPCSRRPAPGPGTRSWA